MTRADEKIAVLEGSIAGLEKGIDEVRSDMSEMKTEMAEMKTELVTRIDDKFGELMTMMKQMIRDRGMVPVETSKSIHTRATPAAHAGAPILRAERVAHTMAIPVAAVHHPEIRGGLGRPQTTPTPAKSETDHKIWKSGVAQEIAAGFDRESDEEPTNGITVKAGKGRCDDEECEKKLKKAETAERNRRVPLISSVGSDFFHGGVDAIDVSAGEGFKSDDRRRFNPGLDKFEQVTRFRCSINTTHRNQGWGYFPMLDHKSFQKPYLIRHPFSKKLFNLGLIFDRGKVVICHVTNMKFDTGNYVFDRGKRCRRTWIDEDKFRAQIPDFGLEDKAVLKEKGIDTTQNLSRTRKGRRNE